MPIFTYTAIKSEGSEVTKGSIEANTLKDAREALRKMDLIPTKLEEQRGGGGATEKKANPVSKAKKIKISSLSTREKIDFTNTLFILSKTGISIIEALLFIEVNMVSKNVQNLASELRKQILQGSSLSDAIAKYPYIFNNIFTGLIKAGEETGELDTTLERMTILLAKQDNLKSKVISTMMYPCFVILLAMAVTTIMLTFVFPSFKEMYSTMGKSLPMLTAVLMSIGIFLKEHWYVIPLEFAAFIFGVYYLFTWPVSKRFIDMISLKIPLISTFVRYSALSNFIAVFKVAFDAGVPVMDGIALANMTIENSVLNEAIKKTAIRIQHGQSLSAALKSSGAIPGIIMCMISTGEQSGQMGDMLGLSSEFIDTQLDRVVDMLNKMVEPVLLVVIGAIVLVLALALYLPLFQSYANL